MPAILKTTQIQEPSSATVNLALDTSGGVTVGQNLTVTGNISVAGTGMAGRLIRAPQILTSGTSYTTPAGCNSIYVEAVGGGGNGGDGNSSSGGSASGGGGGSAAYCAKYFTVTPSTAYTYAVGAATGNTTFTVGATTITASGGSSGAATTNVQTNAGGAGGTATNGDINSNGVAGEQARTDTGAGASSFFGGGAPSVVSTANANGIAAGGFGSGGSGARRAATSGTSTGGAGSQGVIRIWEFT